MPDWLVRVETKCCCRWRGPQRQACKNLLLGREAAVTSFLQVPVLLHSSLNHSRMQCLVEKQMYCTSRESEWKKNYNVLVPGSLFYNNSHNLCFPPVSLRGVFSQRCDLGDEAEIAIWVSNNFNIPCSVFPPFVNQKEILRWPFWALTKLFFPYVQKKFLKKLKKGTYEQFQCSMWWWSYFLHPNTFLLLASLSTALPLDFDIGSM